MNEWVLCLLGQNTYYGIGLLSILMTSDGINKDMLSNLSLVHTICYGVCCPILALAP